jgi:DNA-binding transcriptional regulator YiaG
LYGCLTNPIILGMETALLIMEARDAASSGKGERLRQAAGLSQGELADAIGVTPACVSRWEAGIRRPRGDAAVRYARALRELAERLVTA